MIRGILKRNRVDIKNIKSEEAQKILKKFGEKIKNKIILDPIEALYLVDKGKMEVYKNSYKLSFEELLNYFSNIDKYLLPRFLIYRDLVDRGYKVVKGYSDKIDLLLYKKGNGQKQPARIRVIGIDEGRPIKISDLADELRRSLLSKKNLKIAVIERRGEIVYYSLSFLKGEVVFEH